MSPHNSDRTIEVDPDGTLHIGPGRGRVEVDPGSGQVLLHAASGQVIVNAGDGQVILKTVGKGQVIFDGQLVRNPLRGA